MKKCVKKKKIESKILLNQEKSKEFFLKNQKIFCFFLFFFFSPIF